MFVPYSDVVALSQLFIFWNAIELYILINCCFIWAQRHTTVSHLESIIKHVTSKLKCPKKKGIPLANAIWSMSSSSPLMLSFTLKGNKKIQNV